jgi:hypothetical protein
MKEIDKLSWYPVTRVLHRISTTASEGRLNSVVVLRLGNGESMGAVRIKSDDSITDLRLVRMVFAGQLAEPWTAKTINRCS